MTSSSLPDTAGWHDLELTIDAEVLRCTLMLPARRDDALLVLALHYGGPPHGFYGRGLLEQLVVPAGGARPILFAAPVCRDGDWRSPRDSRAVLTLCEQLVQTYRIAPGRRVLVGYSLGAIGCWHFLAAAPRAFDAVVPVAGDCPADTRAPAVRTFALHAAQDSVFPCADVLPVFERLRAACPHFDFQVLPGQDHYAVGAFRDALSAVFARLPDTGGKPL